MSLATVPEAIADFEAGKFVIVVDDEDRENEGDLVVAAQLATTRGSRSGSRLAAASRSTDAA